MAYYQAEDSFFHGKEVCLGVLMVNLGTPKNTDTSSVKRFLRIFLSDPRVVEIPRLVWLPLLNAIVLPKRSPVVAKNYASIWMDEGSPLMVYSQRQQVLLQQELSRRFSGPIVTELAMAYGDPSIKLAMDNLKAKGAKRLIVLPLYPQYSATTTAVVHDQVMSILQGWRWMPELRLINQYHDFSSYIEALSQSVKAHWSKQGKAERLVMSFHGLPLRNIEQGDPYYCQSLKTGRLLAEALLLTDDEWVLTFQSRFGRAKWIEPATDKTLESLAKSGVSSVDVICPGFSSDCLETLEEIAIQNKELFIQSGGFHYHYIPALNDQRKHIIALADLVQQHTLGWPENSPDFNVSDRAQQLEKTRQRAVNKGVDI